MYCTNCGKKINDDAFFCTYCGARVRVGAGAPAAPQPAWPEATQPVPEAEAPAAADTEPAQPVQPGVTEQAAPAQPTVPIPPAQPAQPGMTEPVAPSQPTVPVPPMPPTEPAEAFPPTEQAEAFQPAVPTVPPAVAQVQPLPATQPVPKPSRKKPASGRRRLIAALCVLLVVLLVLLGVLVYLLVRPAPRKTAGRTDAAGTSASETATAVPDAGEALPTATPEKQSAAVQAYPVQTFPPTPTPLLTDAERETMLTNLRSAQAQARQGDYAGAAQLFQTVSAAAVVKYPAADTFTEGSQQCHLARSAVLAEDGTEQDDDLYLSYSVSYDKDGNVLDAAVFQYADTCAVATNYNPDSSDPYYYHEYTWDENGNIVKRYTEEHVEGDALAPRTTYTYDENGKLLESVEDYGSGTSTYTYTYDEEGRLLSEVCDHIFDFTGVREYTYNENGTIATETSKDWEGNGTGTSTYVYDESGQNVIEIDWVSDASSWSTTYSYTFDAAGNIIETYISYGNALGNRRYTYDADGHELSKEDIKDGQVQSKTESTWSNGRLSVSAFTNGEDYASTTYYYYAPKDLLVSIGEQDGLADSLHF